MYRVDIEPMQGRAEDRRIGDKSGLWKAVVYDQGSGSIVQNIWVRDAAINVPYDEAFKIASELNNTLNA
jgi:hypothetical protein